MLESNKGMDEDFLIILVDWHARLYYPTKEGEPGMVPIDIRRA